MGQNYEAVNHNFPLLVITGMKWWLQAEVSICKLSKLQVSQVSKYNLQVR